MLNIGTQNNYANALDNDAKTLAEVVRILRAHRRNIDVTGEDGLSLDQSIHVLENAASDGDTAKPEVARAGRLVASTAGQLILGAGGNALWEAFKAVVGL